MDHLAVAITLICLGIMTAAIAWLARHSGLKAVSLLLVASVLGIGGGIWMLWP